MKVAITCDYLIGSGHYSQVIALVCELYPEARLFCLAHFQGSVPAVIEQRAITSSFLSKKINSVADFYSYSYLFPTLAKKIFIPCEYDLIINISQGLSQGFSRCEHTKVVTYLYDFDLDLKIKKSFVQKIFYSYVSSWAKKTLQAVSLVLVSRSDLNEKARCLALPIPLSNYALFPKSMFAHDYFIVEASGLTVSQAKNISEWMMKSDVRFKFIGSDHHLIELKKERPELFYGERCAGEHAPVLASASAFISFNEEDFPQYAFATLATGRPVILARRLKKWLQGAGIYYCDFQAESIMAAVDSVKKDEAMLTPQILRDHVTQNDIKFKIQLSNVLKTQL